MTGSPVNYQASYLKAETNSASDKMRNLPERIPIHQCRNGWLYRLYSRNLNLGVYRKADQGFVGIRHKFGARFLFTEFHWDTGPPFGTANPLEAICECPIECLNEMLYEQQEEKHVENLLLFQWIEQQGSRLGITPESC